MDKQRVDVISVEIARIAKRVQMALEVLLVVHIKCSQRLNPGII